MILEGDVQQATQASKLGDPSLQKMKQAINLLRLLLVRRASVGNHGSPRRTIMRSDVANVTRAIVRLLL